GKCDYLFFDGFTVDESDGRQFPRAASDVLQLSHFYRHVPVLHPGLVVRTSVMQAYGFNRDLNLAADFDLMVRFVVDKLSGKHVRFFGVHVVSGGLSEQHRVRARWQATGSLWRHDPSLSGRLKIFISFVRFLALHSLIVGVVHRWPWLRRTLQRIRQSHESPR
ncbi:MAG: hypothetical protein GVY36_04035, partial [Verrucomicrobia bacterium]|nr:hypothetical protein [Verrucomicrobiota bacterium]